jgi:hypothetical protein
MQSAHGERATQEMDASDCELVDAAELAGSTARLLPALLALLDEGSAAHELATIVHGNAVRIADDLATVVKRTTGGALEEGGG